MAKETKPDPEFDLFFDAHMLYGGRKRFVTTEFKNFKQHKDWKEVLPTLKQAIQNLITWRDAKVKAGDFLPEWKQFSNWIDGRWWEEDIPLVNKIQNSVSNEKTPYY